MIRECARVFSEILQTPHPFATRKIYTDAHRLFLILEQTEGKDVVLEMLKLQCAMEFATQFFLPNADYDADHFAYLYWPLGRDRSVVLDPMRRFGEPILNDYRIPTRALYGPYRASDSIADIAEWYEVPEDAVRDAIEFEQRFAERKLAA